MLDAVLLVVGLALLIKGADIFVDAGVGIAKRLRVPTVIIGLTIVAMGTSLPEAVISVTASMQGSNALAISNVVGSNIFNLMLVIGLCAMLQPMLIRVREVSKDFWMSILAAVLLLVFKLIGGTSIPVWGNIILLAVFATYIILVIRRAYKAQKLHDHTAEKASEVAEKTKSLPAIILLAALGCVMIFFGGQLTVDNAIKIAIAMGITERMIGLTIIAIATSLPELITSLVAIKKGENEFALGNIIGSNIFNIMFVLGIAGLVSPLVFDPELIFDTCFLIAGSLLSILFVYTKQRIGRVEGFVMVFLYAAYMTYIIVF